MGQEILEQAILNNAQWCDLVCSTHGVPGEFRTDIWLNRHQTPAFYPNIITLAKTIQPALQAIDELNSLGDIGKYGVKDSYCNLQLESRAFTVLFTAEWIYRPVGYALPRGNATNALWRRIEKPQELKDWETAWNGGKESERRIFLDTLLSHKDVSIVAAIADNRIIAGGIANKSQTVVGISNIFTPSGKEKDFRNDLLAEIAKLYPDLPLVGYESGDSLVLAKELGFESIGKLQVWEN